MIIAYSHAPVVEEILIDRLREYFSTVDWDGQFPNHPLRINNEHPWVPYMASDEAIDSGYVDLRQVSESLFPSITITTTQDAKATEVLAQISDTELVKTEVDAFKAQAETTGYMISSDSLIEMDKYFETNESLYGVNIVYQRQDTINIDIISDDNSNIKNRIYDFTTLFLTTHGNMSLSDDLEIQIIEGSIVGTRSGIYTNEFGRLLRGASIEMRVDYKISQVYYDTGTEAIAAVNATHTTEVIS